MKTNYLFKARWLQGAASANESKKMQVNPRKSLLKEGLSKDESSTRLRVDYVSITSRLRVWQVISSRMAAVFLLLLTLSIGNAWATDVAVNDVLILEEFAGGDATTSFSAQAYSASYSSMTFKVAADASSISRASENVHFSTTSAANMSSHHAWINKSTTGYIEIDNIPLHNTTKFQAHWAQAQGLTTKFYYKFNGDASWSDGGTGSASDDATSNEITVTSGKTSVSIKIQRSSTNKAQRIDNIKLVVTEIAEGDCSELEMSDVTAVPGDRQIALSWAPVDHADSYTVTCVRKSDEATAGTVGSVTGTTTKTCTITGLTNDVEYTWSVKPVGSGDYCVVNTAVTGDAYAGVYYDVTWYNNGGIYKTTPVRSGQRPTFPDAPTSCDDDIDVFYGWATAGWIGSTDDISEKTIYTKSFQLPAVTGNVSYHAVFTDAVYSYNLVESDPGASNWAGDYLIAYSSTIFADGRIGGKDAAGSIGASGIAVNPSTNLSGKVVAASWGDTYCVTLDKVSDESDTYLLVTQDGQYNYRSSNANGLDVTANRATAAPYAITVTYTSSSDIDMASSSAQFHYNTDGFFRFYKDGGQNSVYLYKKTASGTPNYITSCCTPHDVTLTGSGTVTGGTFEVDPTSACASTTISISAEATTGYTFGSWSIYKTGTPATTVSPVDASAASTTFTMPAYAVTVNATFNALTSYSVTWMVDGTTWNDKGGTSSVYEGYKVSTLPTAPDTGDFCGDKFMGWTTDANYVYNSSPLYTTASGFPVASSNQTFYAVFADFNE